MSASAFADKLEQMAAEIDDVPRHELAVVLRRAAIRIRSKPSLNLNDEDEAALARYAADVGDVSRQDAIVRTIRESLMTSGYLPYYDLYDDYEQGE